MAAYFADSPVAGYYTVQHPDQFELSGVEPLGRGSGGHQRAKDHTGLGDAVQAALVAMIDDGTYLRSSRSTASKAAP